ncbi:hypothetical protein VQ042_12415 [Aurantimonas sp. A2-1-M11]|uniref:hypothetical protein n=1 Tax=Aurantimonas sp. A2-1-M11 TaxID=3113712 RepID=UPI002F9256A3
MRRTDLHGVAQARCDDAALLLSHHRWSSAYYLAGYSVELALKACIARQISADTIPDKAIIRDVYSHEFMKLVSLSGLRGELRSAQDADHEFAANWAIASEWSPDARYRSVAAAEAQFLIAAISNREHGVLGWIKQYW